MSIRPPSGARGSQGSQLFLKSEQNIELTALVDRCAELYLDQYKPKAVDQSALTEQILQILQEKAFIVCPNKEKIEDIFICTIAAPLNDRASVRKVRPGVADRVKEKMKQHFQEVISKVQLNSNPLFCSSSGDEVEEEELMRADEEATVLGKHSRGPSGPTTPLFPFGSKHFNSSLTGRGSSSRVASSTPFGSSSAASPRVGAESRMGSSVAFPRLLTPTATAEDPLPILPVTAEDPLPILPPSFLNQPPGVRAARIIEERIKSARFEREDDGVDQEDEVTSVEIDYDVIQGDPLYTPLGPHAIYHSQAQEADYLQPVQFHPTAVAEETVEGVMVHHQYEYSGAQEGEYLEPVQLHPLMAAEEAAEGVMVHHEYEYYGGNEYEAPVSHNPDYNA